MHERSGTVTHRSISATCLNACVCFQSEPNVARVQGEKSIRLEKLRNDLLLVNCADQIVSAGFVVLQLLLAWV